MVSLRCISLVKQELNNLGVQPIAIELGMVEIKEELNPQLHQQLKRKLLKSGLELMDDKKNKLVENANNLIVEMIHYDHELAEESYADYITNTLKCDYDKLSRLFAEVRGINIQNFIIAIKIEKAKELLIYEELSLSEISFKLQYSSVAHLSKQFKKVTGLTPSFFKKLKLHRQKNYSKAAIV